MASKRHDLYRHHHLQLDQLLQFIATHQFLDVIFLVLALSCSEPLLSYLSGSSTIILIKCPAHFYFSLTIRSATFITFV